MLYYFEYTSTEYVCMAGENQPHMTIPKWPKEAHTIRKWSKKRKELLKTKQTMLTKKEKNGASLS